MKQELFTAAFTSILLFLLCSCSSYDSMIDTFNSKLSGKASSEQVFSVNNEDFDEDDMLDSVYQVSYYGQLIVSAPADAAEYKWTIKVPAVQTLAEREQTVCTEQTLTYSFPGICVTGVENMLILTVKDEDGNEYTDHASVLINQD